MTQLKPDTLAMAIAALYRWQLDYYDWQPEYKDATAAIADLEAQQADSAAVSEWMPVGTIISNGLCVESDELAITIGDRQHTIAFATMAWPEEGMYAVCKRAAAPQPVGEWTPVPDGMYGVNEELAVSGDILAIFVNQELGDTHEKLPPNIRLCKRVDVPRPAGEWTPVELEMYEYPDGKTGLVYTGSDAQGRPQLRYFQDADTDTPKESIIVLPEHLRLCKRRPGQEE